MQITIADATRTVFSKFHSGWDKTRRPNHRMAERNGMTEANISNICINKYNENAMFVRPSVQHYTCYPLSVNLEKGGLYQIDTVFRCNIIS